MLVRHKLILEQGDPGLFDVFKRIGRAAVGFATGGPVGALRGAFATTGAAGVSLPPPPPLVLPPIGEVVRPGGGSIPIINVPGVRGVLERAFPGGATGLQVARGAVQQLAGAGVSMAGACPSGFHPNKSSYMTMAGWVEKGSRCVRNRRRNLSNGRANTRALRRMAAWDKQERKLGKTMKAIARGR